MCFVSHRKGRCQFICQIAYFQRLARYKPRTILNVTHTNGNLQERLFTGSCNQPLQYGIQIGLFFGADPITAYFAMRNGLQIQSFNKLVDRQFVWKVGLVSEYKQRDSIQCRLLEQHLKFFACNRQCLPVCRIDNIPGDSMISWQRQAVLVGGTYTIAFTPRQYRSHMDLNLGCPPKSQLQQSVSA